MIFVNQRNISHYEAVDNGCGALGALWVVCENMNITQIFRCYYKFSIYLPWCIFERTRLNSFSSVMLRISSDQSFHYDAPLKLISLGIYIICLVNVLLRKNVCNFLCFITRTFYDKEPVLLLIIYSLNKRKRHHKLSIINTYVYDRTVSGLTMHHVCTVSAGVVEWLLVAYNERYL